MASKLPMVGSSGSSVTIVFPTEMHIVTRWSAIYQGSMFLVRNFQIRFLEKVFFLVFFKVDETGLFCRSTPTYTLVSEEKKNP